MCLLSNPRSPPPARAVKERRHFLVSRPTLPNQDRDLNKGAVLSARAGSSILQNLRLVLSRPGLSDSRSCECFVTMAVA